MRNDFCVFILTHGRPDRVITVETLKRCGYTGKVYLVIDDEDSCEAEYRARYGDQILQFSKSEIAKTFDEGDNFEDRRTITYARNACWDLAKQVGVKYFMHLDDDYSFFGYRLACARQYVEREPRILKLNTIVNALVSFIENNKSVLSIAMSQGGDFIGGALGSGANNPERGMRKCMNSFVCCVDRPFLFRGRFNEDVNTYTVLGSTGGLLFSTFDVSVKQLATQSNSGGITELYKTFGTYVKSFTTVMYSPSSVKVKVMQSTHVRLHHSVTWKNAVPKIIRETHRKTR